MYLVNLEPYTSELYDILIVPALKEFEQMYVTYGRRTITKAQLLKALGMAPLRGVFYGCYRSVLSVVWQNSRSAWEDQPLDLRPPVDIFFLKYYMTPKNYPKLAKGLIPHMKVEIAYQANRSALSAFAKYLFPFKGESFITNASFSIARSFGTNLITAATVYPMAMSAFQGFDEETIIKKTINRAGWESVKSALATVGVQIAASIMPSAYKILKFNWALIAG
jgi:hypothetical protein